MKIKLKPAFAEEPENARFLTDDIGIDLKRAKSWKSDVEIDLALLRRDKIQKLYEFVKEKAKPRTAMSIVAKDIETWIAAVSGAGVKARNCEQLASFLTEELRRAPGHRVYRRDRSDNWLAYYVGRVSYSAAGSGSTSSPASVSVALYWEEFGLIEMTSLNFFQNDCKFAPMDLLAKNGYFIETPDRRAEYCRVKERFLLIAPDVGKQFTAKGTGTDNLDGNPGEDRWSTQTVQLDISGKPARVVVDVFHESEVSSRERDRVRSPDLSFWSKRSVNSQDAECESEYLSSNADDDEELDPVLDPEDIEVPIHPICAVFDLRRYLRLRVHVQNMSEYVYNTNLGDSLVLPADVRRLINLLLVQKGDFKDVIEDKGNGAPILCAGPPGVGKTLTAEVYSEVMERPLYSVQCSQLGLTPEDLESALLLSFRRANRWNAILLLDEADVYVRTRGDDLVQNAIVGVFLRVLEYYSGVLFLTTNRSDKVDDAIISRCIARIDYKIPDVEDQAKIWSTLSKGAGIPMSDETIREIVEKHSDLTGRDIKNLLKLSRMFARSEKRSITVDTITFARRFKPAVDKELS